MEDVAVGTEEILKYSFHRPTTSPVELPTSTVDSVGGTLLWRRQFGRISSSIVLLHGLPKPLADLSFCRQNRSGCGMPGLPVPVSCLGSPISQQGSVRLLLQLDSVPYFWGPPLGSGVAAMTDTRDLVTTAMCSCFNSGGGEHGPLGLNVPSLPRNLGEGLLEVGVGDRADIRLHQMFPTNPQNMFGPAQSVRLPPLPVDPTHRPVVIG
ncbi:uncharacterized protein LOC115439496 [Sphaeramia orbicularis]|uniref:uncharacterized protein LOC115439496 n=1 Tax=Sphaeramia orbicularis TaxID=375764 RepID=UPI00117DF493|nr:uncharacterized protein LOC115439496 [Sphaeramia orbicularis]